MDSRVMTHAELEQVLSDSAKTSLGVTWMMDYIALLQDEVERVKEQRDTYRDRLDAGDSADRFRIWIRAIGDKLGITFDGDLTGRRSLNKATLEIREKIDRWCADDRRRMARILELEEQVRRLSASPTGIGSSAGGGSPSST